jgi:hypothetical protein
VTFFVSCFFSADIQLKECLSSIVVVLQKACLQRSDINKSKGQEETRREKSYTVERKKRFEAFPFPFPFLFLFTFHFC